MKPLTIGKLAQTSGLSPDTICFYEKRELIQPVSRTEYGYRLYDSKVIERLEFIIRATEVGFTLDEITSYSCSGTIRQVLVRRSKSMAVKRCLRSTERFKRLAA